MVIRPCDILNVRLPFHNIFTLVTAIKLVAQIPYGVKYDFEKSPLNFNKLDQLTVKWLRLSLYYFRNEAFWGFHQVPGMWVSYEINYDLKEKAPLLLLTHCLPCWVYKMSITCAIQPPLPGIQQSLVNNIRTESFMAEWHRMKNKWL